MPEQQQGRPSQRGFTLIELMIVMTIIGILASIAVPSYQRSVIKAREAVLMEDLYQMRRAIDGYFADHGKYPDSLEQLVENKYLRAIPTDPMAKAKTAEADEAAEDQIGWEIVAPTPPGDDGVTAEGGVEDVRSTSDLVGLNGIPYREW